MRKVLSRVSELIVLAVLTVVIAAVLNAPSWIGPVDRAWVSLSVWIRPGPAPPLQPLPRPPRPAEITRGDTSRDVVLGGCTCYRFSSAP